MQPSKFKGFQLEIAKNQKQYLPIPAHVENSTDVIITTCWRMNILERILTLFTGRVYVQLMTFGKPLQPQKLSATNPLKETQSHER
jgi:hypothetical protein